jgi:hypothetical protein
MTRLFPIVILVLGLALPAAAQPPVPDRHQSVTRDTDFYGADLQPLFDTTREACRKACFADPDCKAYTYNTRSGACFPKRAVEETQSYEGAISARLFPTDPRVLAQAEARAEELGFLSDGDLDKARALALDIGARHPGGQWEPEVMRDAARSKRAEEDHLNALRWTGALVAPPTSGWRMPACRCASKPKRTPRRGATPPAPCTPPPTATCAALPRTCGSTPCSRWPARWSGWAAAATWSAPCASRSASGRGLT